MVVNHLFDGDFRDLGAIDPPIAQSRDRIMIRREDQASRSAEVNGELTASVRSERMASTWRSFHVGKGRGGIQSSQP
jgi:hypothetical protein